MHYDRVDVHARVVVDAVVLRREGPQTLLQLVQLVGVEILSPGPFLARFRQEMDLAVQLLDFFPAADVPRTNE